MKKIFLTLTILSLSVASIFSVENIPSNKGLVIESGSVNLFTDIDEKGMSFRAMADPWHSYAFGLNATRKIDLSKVPTELQKVDKLSIIGTGDVASDSVVKFIFKVTPFKRIITSSLNNVTNETTVIPEIVVTTHYPSFDYFVTPVESFLDYNQYEYTFTIKEGVYNDGITLMNYYLQWYGSEQFSSGKYLSVVTITYQRD